MSFTSDVKKELTQLPPATGTLLALIRMNGSLGLSRTGLTLSVTTGHAATAGAIFQMLLELYENRAEIQHHKQTLTNRTLYTVFLDQGVRALLDELQLSDALLLDHGVPELVRADSLFQADYLRGAFLSAGSIANPERAYNLEIASSYEEHARDLQQLLTGLLNSSAAMSPESTHHSAKLTAHNHHFILYMTRAEAISDFLTLIGAMKSRLAFENIKMLREMRGLANRQANFETANIAKTVSASQEVIKAIDKLVTKGKLPEDLNAIAMARLNHPESSLTELGQLVHPPLSKSSVARRLTKLVELAKSQKK